jgi:TetR/AcrR family transcriptional regulator, transcriptional repressor for nem operon
MDLKRKIIQESLKLFSLKGFLSTSIQDILIAAGTSKGGLYNHFKSKEDLFLAVLGEARKVWRERNLEGLDLIDTPAQKVKALLKNYRDRYLRDVGNFPGGCIFVTLSVELDDQRPHLSREINKGFEGFKAMLKRLLDEGKASGELRPDVNTEAVTEMIFVGMLGASVLYGTEKSEVGLNRSIEALIQFLDTLTSESEPVGSDN